MRNHGLELVIESIFRTGSNLEFHDGMDNDFKNELSEFIRTGGLPVVIEIYNTVRRIDFVQYDLRFELAGESLKVLGELIDKRTYTLRREILEYWLSSDASIAIRDGALHGLMSMCDPLSRDTLERARKREGNHAMHSMIDAALSVLAKKDE